MPKKKQSHEDVANQFSDQEMDQIKHYGQMLGGGVTPFDEAVEEALNKREAAEMNAAKMPCGSDRRTRSRSAIPGAQRHGSGPD
jgi:hypothetical protein